MASMGLLGAIGGLGEGMLKRAESMEKEKLMDAEEAKAKRLAQFGAGLKETAATTTYERGVAETKRGEGIASGAAETKAEALLQHQEAERESRLDVQKLKNVGAREGGGTPPKWMKERWSFSKVTGGQDVGFEEQLVVRDNKTGTQYTQRGDIMLRGVAEPKISPDDTSSEALNDLRDNISDEGAVYEFLDHHGYLPVWVFEYGAFEPSYKGE